LKTNVLYVESSKFLTVLTELEVPFTVQSGFIRVEGAKGRRLYVAATKKVGRVDISGFEVDFGAKIPHCGPFGNVKQQMDLSPELGEEGILANFKALVQHMLLLPAVVKEVKIKAPKAPRVSKKAASAPVPENPEAIKSRMDLIKRIAAEKGLSVSSKTLALAEE